MKTMVQRTDQMSHRDRSRVTWRQNTSGSIFHRFFKNCKHDIFDVVFDVWTCSILLVVAVHCTHSSSAVGRLDWQLLEQPSPKWRNLLELPSDKLRKQNKKNRNPEFCAINPVVLQVSMPCTPIQVVVCDLFGVFSLALRFSDEKNGWLHVTILCFFFLEGSTCVDTKNTDGWINSNKYAALWGKFWIPKLKSTTDTRVLLLVHRFNVMSFLPAVSLSRVHRFVRIIRIRLSGSERDG